MVALADTVTVVSLVTSPDVKRPEPEILVAAEFSNQLGDAGCEDPSLNIAVAVNCTELFSLNELGPLMARELNVTG